MDSEAAARGVFALRQAAEGRDVELVTAMQEAFYVDGLSLSDPATYRALAEAAGLDADSVVRAFGGPAAVAAAKGDFAPSGRARASTAFPPCWPSTVTDDRSWPSVTPASRRSSGASRPSPSLPDHPLAPHHLLSTEGTSP